MKTRNETAGLRITAPTQTCQDKKCPFHGDIKLRGRQFTGTLVKVTVNRSATLEFDRNVYSHKYERSEKRRTKLHVHNPPCINAQEGDRVSVSECRRLSKTKKFVIIENHGKEHGFAQRKELLEEGKYKHKRKAEKADEEDSKESAEQEE